jgi:UDP-2-acetamido-2,6-beta-L-arabino-hexul-4-ose reductase
MEGVSVSTFSRDDVAESLEEKVLEADFIFHLAGINRPEDPQEFYEGNRELTQRIVDAAKKSTKHIPILMTSSTQVERDNDYGKSKREGEVILEAYAEESASVVYIYRLPNVFGKWSKPNYNTVIATWCHNVTREIPLQVNNESVELTLVYIDDVVNQFVRHLDENGQEGVVYGQISPVYKKTLGEIRDLLLAFKESRTELPVPRVGRGVERA